MKRLRTITAALMGAALVAALLVGLDAGPVTAGTAGDTTYELSCNSDGSPLPLLLTMSANATPDPRFPTGATFGAQGAASATVVGPIIATLLTFGPMSEVGVNLGATVTAAGATGSYAYSASHAKVPTNGRRITTISWGSGATTLTGAAGKFQPGDVGKSVASSFAGIAEDAVITAVAGDGTSATISAPTTAAQTNRAIATGGDMTFTDPAFDTGAVFTTAGSDGGTATVAVTSTSGFTLLTTGLGDLTATDDCSIADTPAFASVALVNAAPQVSSNSAQALAGTTTTLGVLGSDADDGIDPTTWAAGPVSCGSGSATAIPTANSTSATQIAFDASAISGATTCSFAVTVRDNAGKPSVAATQTVNIVAGDDLGQGLVQQVIGGVLDVQACGSSHPDPATCRIVMPAVTLDGSDQTSTGAVNQLTVIDARGLPAAWTLSAQLEGALANGGFPGSSDPNASIAASDVTLSPTACAARPGNTNANPAVGSSGGLQLGVTICSATAGQNSGGFTADAAVQVLVRQTKYAGTYTGTIDFVVQ